MSTPFDMLQRLSALIDEEAAALNTGNLAVIKDINFRKSHVLLELSRAGRTAPDLADPATAALASNMRKRLAAHEVLLGRHLEAMHELTSLVTHAIKREDSDGTYSATAGARRTAGQAPRP